MRNHLVRNHSKQLSIQHFINETMSIDFTGKVALCTGAASGIGRATAIKLASLGATLSLQDINDSGLTETLALCNGPGHITETFDVSSSDDCNSFIQFTIKELGGLDYVFNCAGINPTAYPLTSTTDDYFNKLVSVNLKGTYNITRAAMAVMKEGAAFVNVSSTMGINVAAEYAIYCMTKFGIVGFSKAMAMELGPKVLDSCWT